MNLDGTHLQNILAKITAFFNYVVYSTDSQDVTLARILFVVFIFLVLLQLAKRVRLATTSILSKRSLSERRSYNAARIVEICYWILSIFLILDLLGMGISKLFAVMAALGIGIGFGLQGLFKNLINGLVMIIEEPVHVGDVIEVGETLGIVRDIGWRATRISTWDNVEVLIPNSELLENQLVNWTLSDSLSRITVRFSVAYGTAPELVVGLATKSTAEHPTIETSPEPTVQLESFGADGLDFSVFGWTKQPWRRNIIASEIRLTLLAALTEANIEIPYPQRDLHLRSVESAAIADLKSNI